MLIAFYDQGRSLGAALGRRRRDLDAAAGDRPRAVPAPPRASGGAAADFGDQLGRPRLRRLGRAARSAPAAPPNDIVYTSSADGDRLDPGGADPDRRRRCRASGPRRRPGAEGRLALTCYVFAGRRSTSASSGRGRPARAGAGRSCSTRATCRSSGIAADVARLDGRRLHLDLVRRRPRRPVFALAQPPRAGRLRESMFATSLAVP